MEDVTNHAINGVYLLMAGNARLAAERGFSGQKCEC